MNSTETTKAAKILEQVRALIAKADSTGFEAEADAFRQKADQLMAKYAIEAWQVEAAQAGINPSKQPERRDVSISWWYNTSADYSNDVWSLFTSIARHCRVVLVSSKQGSKADGSRDYHSIPAIGLPTDLDYFDMLFTSVQLEMSRRMAPKPAAENSRVTNVVLLKEAGYSWERIHELLREIGQQPDEPFSKKVVQPPFREYKKWCEVNDAKHIGANPKTYQRNFAQGFTARMRRRVAEMAEATRSNYDADHQSGSMALAERDIAAVIKEKVWDIFPDLRPHPDTCDCDQCHRCHDPKCNRTRCREARKPVRRSAYRDTRVTDWAAQQAGAKAADETNLSNNPGSRLGGRKEIG